MALRSEDSLRDLRLPALEELEEGEAKDERGLPNPTAKPRPIRGGAGRRVTMELLELEKLLAAGHTLTPAQLVHVQALSKHYRQKTAERAERAKAAARASAEFPFAPCAGADQSDASDSDDGLGPGLIPGGLKWSLSGALRRGRGSVRSSRSVLLEASAEQRLMATLERLEVAAEFNEATIRRRRETWMHRNSLRHPPLPLERGAAGGPGGSAGGARVRVVAAEEHVRVGAGSTRVSFGGVEGGNGDGDGGDGGGGGSRPRSSSLYGVEGDESGPRRRKSGKGNTRGLQALGGFAIGDHVSWCKADEDIPEGASGLVVGFIAESERAKCRFPKGTFALKVETLTKVVVELSPVRHRPRREAQGDFASTAAAVSDGRGDDRGEHSPGSSDSSLSSGSGVGGGRVLGSPLDGRRRSTRRPSRWAEGNSSMPRFKQPPGAYAVAMRDLRLAEAPFASGGGGRVFRGKYMAVDVAAKQIWTIPLTAGVQGAQMTARGQTLGLEHGMSEAQRREFDREATILASLHHPNVLAFYGVAKDDRSPSRALDSGIAVGDRVRWTACDDDIPAGCVGEVLGFKDATRAVCRFPRGAFALKVDALVKAPRPSDTSEPGEDGNSQGPVCALYMVFEWCDGGDLKAFYRSDAFCLAEFVRVGLEVLGGVAYLHELDIAHRDIKPENVLLTAGPARQVKLADFGLAVRFRRDHAGKGVGTIAYMAPEMMANDDWADGAAPAGQGGGEGGGGEGYGYDAKAGDMYAVGLLLWELWARRPPWEGLASHALVAKVLRGKRPSLERRAAGQPVRKDSFAALQHPPALSPALAALLRDCWDGDPLRRPTARSAFARFEALVAPEVGRLTPDALDASDADRSDGRNDGRPWSSALAVNPPQLPPRPVRSLSGASLGNSSLSSGSAYTTAEEGDEAGVLPAPAPPAPAPPPRSLPPSLPSTSKARPPSRRATPRSRGASPNDSTNDSTSDFPMNASMNASMDNSVSSRPASRSNRGRVASDTDVTSLSSPDASRKSSRQSSPSRRGPALSPAKPRDPRRLLATDRGASGRVRSPPSRAPRSKSLNDVGATVTVDV